MRHLSNRIKKILDSLFEQKKDYFKAHPIINISDFPEVYKQIYGWGYYTPKTPFRDIYENLDSDMQRYLEDKIHNIIYGITKEDIEKYATEDDKKILKEWHGQKVMNFVEYEERLRNMSMEELKFARKDAAETARLHDQMEREGIPNNAGYYWDEVLTIEKEIRKRMEKNLKDDIDKYATEEEKEILKESLADTRAMNFIKKSGGDIEVWKEMIKKMSEREVKEATFEFQSAIDGINHQFKHWMVPRKVAKRFGFSDEHWAYRESMESRRKMYRKYLNILKQFNMRESKEIVEAANPKGKTRKVDDPYETYYGAGDWEWRVLKHYQTPDKERSNPYARVYCAVKSPFTFGSWEYGDTYCKDIPGYKYE